jgi:hypothetical protein
MEFLLDAYGNAHLLYKESVNDLFFSADLDNDE